MIKHVNILGTKYDVYFLPEKELRIKDANGYCEVWSKKIFINETAFESCEDLAECVDLAKNKTLRHEIIHATLHEAGLGSYSLDETLVDALATLIPKMSKIFTEMEANE